MVRWPLQIITCANQKGGVGKTTTSTNLAAGLALAGYHVCLVDTDQQRNATKTFGVNIDALLEQDPKTPTVLDIYARKLPAIDAVRVIEGKFDGRLSIIPSHRSVGAVFTKLEVGLVHQAQDGGVSFEDQQDLRLEFAERLRESLKSLETRFDVAVIDTPPTLDFILSTALRAADWLVIPLVCAEYAKDGLRDLISTVQKVKERSNPRLKLLRAVVGDYDGRTVLHRDMVGDFKQTFGDKLSPNYITHGVRVEELPSHRLSIFEHAPGSEQAKQFTKLTDEVIGEIEAHLAKQRERARQAPSVETQGAQVAVGEG